MLTSSLEDLTRSLGAIGQSQLDDLVVSRELDILHDDQRSIDTADGVIPDSRYDRVGGRFSWIHGFGCCFWRTKGIGRMEKGQKDSSTVLVRLMVD
jgi:hypothetical protein